MHRLSTLAIVALLLVSAACQQTDGDTTPPVKSKTAEAVTVEVPVGKATAAPPPTAPAPAPPGLATDKPADPDRMPMDALHAPFRGQAAAGQGLPAGHPPIGGARPGATAPAVPTAGAGAAARPAAPQPDVEKNVERPLPLEGAGSADELKRRLAAIEDEAVRKKIDDAFRMTFTADRSKRDPAAAGQLLADLGDHPEAGAVAARIMGYVAVSTGFDVKRANAAYRKAIALDADYGEAHYALAFMLSMNDRDTGRIHFDRAVELGVPDTRGIARFYPAK